MESGHIENVKLSSKQNVTKKNSVDVELVWTPESSGEYLLKLYVLDGSRNGSVLKDPIINEIYVEPANSSLASLSPSSKN